MKNKFYIFGVLITIEKFNNEKYLFVYFKGDYKFNIRIK